MAGLDGNITIKSGEYRPCTVDGQKALFHRWADKDRLIIKFDCFLTKAAIDAIMEKYEKTNVLPRGVTKDKITTTLAIIELEDGTVKEVEPMGIKFLDSKSLFLDKYFNCKEDDIDHQRKSCKSSVYDGDPHCENPNFCDSNNSGYVNK